jgi:antirestriction protein ArdC
VVSRSGEGLRRAGLDDLQTGNRAKRESPQGRAWQSCRLRRQDRPHRDGRRNWRGSYPFLKGYTVFNVEQIDGLPERFYAKPAPRAGIVARIERTDSFFASTGATIRHSGAMACYNVSQDFVQMPPFTVAHEVTHWTRHKSRLDRDFGRKRFGDEGYAMEELVVNKHRSGTPSQMTAMP